MLRALYTAGTGMLTQMKQMDVTGNNISNANTGGYKKDRSISVSFGDMLVQRINEPGKQGQSAVVGPLNLGISMDEVITDHEQGPMEYTGKSTDLSIYGNGFFAVETQNGERYTRGGSFFVNSEGNLVIGDGYRLMGENGPIETGTDDFIVDSSGNVFVNDVYMDTLKMVDFQDPNLFVKDGNLLFQNTGAQGNLVAFTGEATQGSLEGSNVDITNELIQMMASARNYDSNQRMIRMLDDTLAKTVNEVGRL
ncbi:MAG: flagellar hook-basal body protein [Firmicutes bacterium]|nr:flagellar hook-basal body protein [Bacillota bacterium]